MATSEQSKAERRPSPSRWDFRRRGDATLTRSESVKNRSGTPDMPEPPARRIRATVGRAFSIRSGILAPRVTEETFDPPPVTKDRFATTGRGASRSGVLAPKATEEEFVLTAARDRTAAADKVLSGRSGTMAPKTAEVEVKDVVRTSARERLAASRGGSIGRSGAPKLTIDDFIRTSARDPDSIPNVVEPKQSKPYVVSDFDVLKPSKPTIATDYVNPKQSKPSIATDYVNPKQLKPSVATDYVNPKQLKPSIATDYVTLKQSKPSMATDYVTSTQSRPSIATDFANMGFKRTTSTRVEDLADPLPPLESALDENDLKESAYEILVGVAGVRADLRRSNSGILMPRFSDNKDTTSNRFRMALGLTPRSEEITADTPATILTPLEVVCRQMGISEFSDMRTRKALSRASASQVGRKIENLIAPLELLQHLGPTDFSSQRDYMRWKRRQVALLEQGLLYSSVNRSDNNDHASLKLRKILTQAQNGEIDLQDAQTKQALRVAVLSKAENHGKELDPRQNRVHWADGYPLNIALYEALLKSVFDPVKESELVPAAEDMLDQVRKTWPVLGINPMLHHLSFSWILFRQFVKTGKKQLSLVSAAEAQIREAIRLFKEDVKQDPSKEREVEVKLLKGYLGSMQGFAEKRLFAYREAFPGGARGVMERLVAIELVAEDILQSEAVQGYQAKNRQKIADPAREKAESFIRSSVKQVFAEYHEQATSRRRSFRGKGGLPPILVSLAVDSGELAGDEVSLYCPAFKEWCPSAGAVAAATVHGCYKRELKGYLSDTKLLTQEAAQVLLAAHRLEKQLVQMAVEDGEDCEDGGASAIRDMPPYETEAAMQTLLNHWVEDRLAKFGEWVDRTVEEESWDPNVLKDHIAPSAVDVMRLLDETMEAFFELPLPPNGDILVLLSRGMESAVERYCTRTLATIGSKDQFMPPLPPLTRYKKDVFSKAQPSPAQSGPRRPGPGGGGGALPQVRTPTTSQPTAGAAVAAAPALLETLSLPRLCCRINTLHYCVSQTDALLAQVRVRWEQALAPAPASTATGTRLKPQGIRGFFTSSKEVARNIPLAPPLPSEMLDLFQKVKEQLEAGVNQVAEFAAFRVVFSSMRAVVLDGLYVGGVQKARISTVVEALRPHLIDIVDNIAGPMRDRLVFALLRALLAALLRVLLAAGSGRAYAITDAPILEADLQQLKDLFVDGGEGLPQGDVKNATALASQILHLFSCDTDDLIRSYEAAYKEWLKTQGGGASARDGKLPPTTGHWSPTDANTILRVLCYRADRRASKFLKKIFDLPKEVRR